MEDVLRRQFTCSIFCSRLFCRILFRSSRFFCLRFCNSIFCFRCCCRCFRSSLCEICIICCRYICIFRDFSFRSFCGFFRLFRCFCRFRLLRRLCEWVFQVPEHFVCVHEVRTVFLYSLCRTFLPQFSRNRRTNICRNGKRICHAGIHLRNFQYVQLELTAGDKDTHAVCAFRQLVNDQTSLTGQTAGNKAIFVHGVSVDQYRKFCILRSTNNGNAAALKGTGEFRTGFRFHRGAVVEVVAFHGMYFPVFVVQDAVSEAVHTADIRRLYRSRLQVNVPEHIPCVFTAKAGTTAVDHALRRIFCQEIAVDEEEDRVAQYHQFQLVPLFGVNVLRNALCRNAFHIH